MPSKEKKAIQVEDKQSALPSFSEQALQDIYKPVYEVRNGHIVMKQGDAISISGTYIGPKFLDVETATIMRKVDKVPRVLSIIYSNPDKLDEIAGYIIIDEKHKAQLVMLSGLAEFLSSLNTPLVNATVDAAYQLGKALTITDDVHRIYLYYPNKADSQSKGIRNGNGSIKILTPDRISRHWFCSLSYKDLRTLYDYYNKQLFDNKLCQAVTFKWLTNSNQPSYVEITLQQENDALKTEFIEGYKVMRVVIHINREFFKANPHLFLEIFIHDLIHSLGIPANHTATFSRYCELVSSKLEGLEILDIDARNITDAKGKWSTVDLSVLKSDTHDTVAMLCPVCENLLRAGRNNTCVCLQGHTFKCK